MRVFGVFLGTEQVQKQNWEGMLDKVVAKLSKWRWLLPLMSFRGRVLVLNNLAASVLWHRLCVLEPPRGLLKELQKRLVDFFWTGQHWTRAAVLHLPLQEGGQGLVDLQSRVTAFRLQTAKRLLYHPNLSWRGLAWTLLRRAGGLGYDRQLFLLSPGAVDITALTPFYRSVLSAWHQTVTVKRSIACPEGWVLQEPLIHNPLLPVRIL